MPGMTSCLESGKEMLVMDVEFSSLKRFSVLQQQRSQTSEAHDDVNLGPSANPKSVASPSPPV